MNVGIETPKPPTLERLFTPEEAAEALRVKTRTVMGWLRLGTLRGVKPGGKLWRIRESDLKAFIEQGSSIPK
jgi:excisionase family DNA binding protein